MSFRRRFKTDQLFSQVKEKVDGKFSQQIPQLKVDFKPTQLDQGVKSDSKSDELLQEVKVDPKPTEPVKKQFSSNFGVNQSISANQSAGVKKFLVKY